MDGTGSGGGLNLDDVRINGHVDGINAVEIIASDLRYVLVSSAKRDGIGIYGASTSINLHSYTQGNGRNGVYVDGPVAYLHFDATASDKNGGSGYYFNSNGAGAFSVVMNAPGAEGNQACGIYASDATGLVINAPFLSRNAGDGIWLDGVRNSVLEAGLSYGSTAGWGLRITKSTASTTPAGILSLAMDIGNNFAGDVSDTENALSRFTDSSQSTTKIQGPVASLGVQDTSIGARPACNSGSSGLFYVDKSTVPNQPWVCLRATAGYVWTQLAVVP
jgi:hypothetical protein